VCEKSGHHTLLCKEQKGDAEGSAESAGKLVSVASSHTVRAPAALSLYAVVQAVVMNSGKTANIFCDNGSNTSYITHKAAERLKAKKLERYTLDVTTMGNMSHEYDTRL
jgi:hypothetical protein